MLKKFRQQIDLLDKKILKLLSERATIAKDVAEYKKKSNNTNIFRPDRESQIIKNLRSLNSGPLSAEHIHNIYREIISSCLSLETNLTVSYLGPEGTYSEIATNKFFGKSVTKNSRSNIFDVFNDVKNKTSDFGVVPVENSNQGSIKSTLDFLIRYKTNICGEQNIPIKHCLMSKSKSLKNIKKIYAHNQTLAQCDEWISKNLPNLEIDARLMIYAYHQSKEKKINIINKKLTKYIKSHNNISSYYSKFSINWWHKRKEAFDYLRYILQTKNENFIRSLDFFVTNMIYFLTFFKKN